MNRLANESSAYLREHADNPVDWWPWSDAALAAAREQDKPILLSIGYSACHWCHVMARESFENKHIAALMNERFINIKVDREQRPDIDRIYQTAHQLIMQRPGGWPLTAFLTPDGELPFFAGTYFPPQARQGMPGLPDVLDKVAQFYHDNPAEARRQGAAVQEVFARLEPEAGAGGAPDAEVIARLRQQLEMHFDAEHGGFGSAPKFPQITSLRRLLNHWRASANGDAPDLQALLMTTLSQARMAAGGLFDHVGGGFFRYCVDRDWQIPHFEKMLYDNAQLLELYADTAQATGDAAFTETASAVADWLLRDMRGAHGGFFATIDAETAAGEGVFYTFSLDELRDALDDNAFALAHAVFALEQPPNFDGRYHLQRRVDLETLAAAQQLTVAELGARIDALLATLYRVRGERIAPAIDEKILTANNALTIKALASAARTLERPALADAAISGFEFLWSTLRDDDGLLCSWQDGQPGAPGFLDDYACTADALLTLLQLHWRESWYAALEWTLQQMLEQFFDADTGALCFTGARHETLIVRQRPIADEATPAGNAIAARVLLRAGTLTGNTRYLEIAERILGYAASALADYPEAHASMIEAVADYHAGLEVIVLRGDADTITQWQRSLQSIYAPTRMVFAIARGADLPDALADKVAPATGALAYPCRGLTCQAPIDNWRELARAIRNR